MSSMQSMVCHKRQWHGQWSKTGCGPLHWLQHGGMRCACRCRLLPGNPTVVQKHYKHLWMLSGNFSLQHVGVLRVYVVHGLVCVAFLGWHVPLGPVVPW